MKYFFLGLLALALIVGGGSALDANWYKDQVSSDSGASVSSGSLDQLVGKQIDYIEDETGAVRTCVVRQTVGGVDGGAFFCVYDDGEGMGPRWVMMESIRSFTIYDSATPNGIENVPGFSAVFGAVAVLGAVLVCRRRA